MNIPYEPFDDSFSYLEWIVAARQTVYDYDISTSSELSTAFDFISANLETFLPTLPKDQHLTFCKEVKWHQIWAAHDQHEFHLTRNTQVVDRSGLLESLKGGEQAAIFCTYHVGSYRLLNMMLYDKGIPFSLLADNEFVTAQGEDSRSGARRLQQEYLGVDPVELEIIDAENPSGALRSLRRLKSNRSLLVYIDGNTGVGGHFQDREKFVDVEFFSRPIYARKGVAFLAYAAGVPIIPAICVRTGWLQRTMYFLEPIVPDRSITRDEFCMSATQTLYANLESYLRSDPEQWEGWMYVHKFLNTEKLMQQHAKDTPVENKPIFDVQARYRFNDERFALLMLSEEDFLFDRRTFQTYPLDDTLKQVLNAFKEPKMFSELKFHGFTVTEEAINDLLVQDLIKIS